jgi:predicted phosphohydrolase
MNTQETPILRVAIVGDIQGYHNANDWGMHNLESAFELLSPLSPDVMIMTGDLADYAEPLVFPYYMNLVKKHFPKKVPVQAACMGNHDYWYKGEEIPTMYSDFCKALEVEEANPLVQVVNGFHFISISEKYLGGEPNTFYSEELINALEEKIQQAIAENSNNPVFVISHFGPAKTMTGSNSPTSACQRLRKVLDKYPQVVSFSGHTHVPLEDERSIWQGEFTAIQTSGLSYCCVEERCYNSCSVIPPFAREGVQCLYMEIFADRMEIHRYNAEDKREIKPDNIWKVAYPYNPSSAQYTSDRAEARVAPKFKDGTTAFLRYDFGFLYLIFDEAIHEDFVHFYDLVLYEVTEDGQEILKGKERFISNFYRLERNRDPRQVLQIPGYLLSPIAKMKAEIYPVETFGKVGEPLVINFKNPMPKPKEEKTLRPQE